MSPHHLHTASAGKPSDDLRRLRGDSNEIALSDLSPESPYKNHTTLVLNVNIYAVADRILSWQL